MKKVLIVRLDAIGDYILWRNCLRFIRNSAKYRTAHITILGNPAWRNLAETFDSDCADEWIWVENRAELFRKSAENVLPYCVWHRRVERSHSILRKKLTKFHFDEVISLSAFPDPLLDELVMGIAPVSIAVEQGERLHSARFTRLLDSGREPFVFLKNRKIAEALTDEVCDVPLELSLHKSHSRDNRILFFTGASHWTKRWPMRRWRELSRLLPVGFRSEYAVMSHSLAEFAEQVAGSSAIVSNDTMALHLAAALNVPTVGVTNGCTGRDSFWPYPSSLGKRLVVVSPQHEFSGILPGLPGRQIAQYRALASISAASVADALTHLVI